MEIGKIEAPFLGPVTLDALRVRPAKEKARRVDLQAARVTLDFNFRGWLFHPTRPLRAQHRDRPTARDDPAGETTRRGQARLEKPRAIVTGRFSVLRRRSRCHDCGDRVPFSRAQSRGKRSRGGKVFRARDCCELAGSAEDFHQTARCDFVGKRSPHDRRACRWSAGLDLEALTIDLASLEKRRVGLELQFDTFGGSFASELSRPRREKNSRSISRVPRPTFRSRRFLRRPAFSSR